MLVRCKIIPCKNVGSILNYSSTRAVASRFDKEAEAMMAVEPPPFRQGIVGATAPPVSRHSVGDVTATVFGGTGFLGRYLVHELGVTGNRAIIPFRGCELEVRHLKTSFDLGQLGLIPFSPRDEDSILECIKNSDVVINLIGKHYETQHIVPTRRADGKLSRTNYSFEDVNVTIPATLARLCKAAGVKSFVHVSALSQNLDSASKWSSSKARGEAAVREVFPTATIVRPATIFGHEDRFLNWIAESYRLAPFFPLLQGGAARVRPVYAEDVGRALFNITKVAHIHIHPHPDPCTNETCVSIIRTRLNTLAAHLSWLVQEFTYKEIAEFVTDVTTLERPLVDFPVPIAKLLGKVGQLFVDPILTEDMIERFMEDAIPNPDSNPYTAKEIIHTFKELNITPTTMDKKAFDYLHRFRPGGHFRIVEGYH